MSTSSRVIKNTIFLYVRMAVTIIVALYSTRLILKALGTEDFGIFNVVGGSIAMLGFFNSTLANATQRFMSCALGEGKFSSQLKVFNVTIVLQFIIGLITVGCLIVIMPWLFGDVLNIEPTRINSAKIVYYCLIFSTFLTILNVPYEAIINAHENMGYYTLVGFLESVIRLGIAFICIRASHDRLILYGICMSIMTVITFIIMKVYCHKKYPECIIAPKKYFDATLLKDIASFSGWNFLTAISHIATLQGLGLVLNHFYGAVLNAAQGISNQVNSQLSNFAQNMRKALNPVITKKTARGEMDSMNTLVLTGCKYSCFLLLLFGVPVAINIKYILKLWLIEVPEWTAIFCIMQLLNTLIVQSTSAIATSIYATGRIKLYAIFKSLTNVLPVIIIYAVFWMGGSPIWLYIPVIVFLGIGGDIVIVYYAHNQCGLSIKGFINKVCWPTIGVLFAMLLFGSIIFLIDASDIWNMLISSAASVVGLTIALISFGITSDEMVVFKNMITRLINRYIKSVN